MLSDSHWWGGRLFSGGKFTDVTVISSIQVVGDSMYNHKVVEGDRGMVR